MRDYVRAAGDSPVTRSTTRNGKAALLMVALLVIASAAWTREALKLKELVPQSSCNGYSSNADPPPLIKVYRTATGTIDVVDFKLYVKRSLNEEMPASWDIEALRAGALAVKSYGWYWVKNWRGGTAGGGACYDVSDNPDNYQDYSTVPVDARIDAAVEFTWNTVPWVNGILLEGRHQRSLNNAGESCGQYANGIILSQYGAQACAANLDYNHRRIMSTYYSSPLVGFVTPRSVATISTKNSSIQYQVARAPNTNTYYFRQNNATGFGPWSAVPGNWVTNPGVTSSVAGWMDVYGKGTDGQMWHVYYGAGVGWSQLEALGGAFNTAPAAASWAADRQDIFVVGVDGRMYHKAWTDAGGWWPSQSGWAQELPGLWMSAPGVAAWSPGRLDVFVQGLDGAVWHQWYSGGWACAPSLCWENRGGWFASSPAATSQMAFSLNVTAVGVDGQLWQDAYGPWTGWHQIGGQIRGDPSIASFGPNAVDFVGNGQSPNVNQLWERQWRGAWGSWFVIGCVPTVSSC